MPRSPGEISFVELNRDEICMKPEEWRDLGLELGRRQPSSVFTPGSGGSPISRWLRSGFRQFRLNVEWSICNCGTWLERKSRNIVQSGRRETCAKWLGTKTR